MFNKPSNKEFRSIFDKHANEYDVSINNYALLRRIEFIKKYAEGECLEVGAGTGEISKALIKKHRVIATDISPKMVEIIKGKLKIKAYSTDAEKLPFKDCSFDSVVGAEMIYYLDNPSKFINETYRILKPGGKLILTSANSITVIYDLIRSMLRVIGVKSMYFDDKNRKFMSLTELRNIIKINKFKFIVCQKSIIFPLRKFDWLNRILENTFIKHLGCFVYVVAKKN